MNQNQKYFIDARWEITALQLLPFKVKSMQKNIMISVCRRNFIKFTTLTSISSRGGAATSKMVVTYNSALTEASMYIRL